MKPLSPSARAIRDEEILRLRRANLSEREIAKRIGWSRSTVWNVLQKYRW